MSDAPHTHIEDDVQILVRLCGYSPELARAELTAFSYRERAGLIPVGDALATLARTPDKGNAVGNRRRWRDALRGSAAAGELAA